MGASSGRHSENIRLNGVLVGRRGHINFSGTGISSITDDAANDEVDVATTGSGAGGSAHTIKEEGTPLTDRAGLNFGPGFDLTDDAGNNETDVALDLSEVAGGGDITWTGNTPAVNDNSHAHDATTVSTHSTAHANDHARSHDHSAAADGNTLTPATLNLPAAAAPSQTADGQVVWDSDDNLLTVGDGASRQTFLPVNDATSNPADVTTAAADGTEATAARKDHVHAIANDAVTYAKMQNVSAASRLLGRGSAGGAGDPEEITLGSGLSMSGTTLSASGGSGSVATDTIWDAKGDIAVATGADAAARLAVGTNFRDRLVPDSSQTSGLLWVPHLIRQTADVVVNNSTTLTDLTGLSWSIGTGSEVWFFQYFGRVTSPNQTGDLKFGFGTMPTGATMSWGALATANAVQAGFTTVTTANSPSALLAAGGTYSAGSAANTSGISLAGWVFGSTTAGTIQLQAAQNTADANNTTFLANSILLLWRLV